MGDTCFGGGLASETAEEEDEGDPRDTNLVTPSADSSSISLLIFGPKYERRVAVSLRGRMLLFAMCALSLSFCRIG